MRKVGSRVASSSLHSLRQRFKSRSTRGGSVGIFMYQSMSALLHLGKSTTLRALGFKVLKHFWTYQVSYVFPPTALFHLVLSNILVEGVMGHFRILILVATCQMEAAWLPTVLNILEGIPHQHPIVKKSSHGCFGRPERMCRLTCLRRCR